MIALKMLTTTPVILGSNLLKIAFADSAAGPPGPQGPEPVPQHGHHPQRRQVFYFKTFT